MTRSIPLFALAALVPLLGPAAARAGEPPPRKDWLVVAGAGVASTPRYPGSSEQRVVAIPLVRVEYKNRFFLGPSEDRVGAGLGVRLLDRGPFVFSLSVSGDQEREESDADALAGLGDRDFSIFGSASVAYRGAGGRGASLSLSRSLRSAGGWRATLWAGVDRPLGERWFGGVGLSVTAGDAANLTYDFGITPAQAARRAELVAAGDARLGPGDVGPFDSGSGLRGVAASGSLRYALDERWSALLAVDVSRVVGDAADSPLVREATGITVGLGAMRRF